MLSQPSNNKQNAGLTFVIGSLQIFGFVMSLQLQGCGSDDLSDLNRYVSSVKARPKGNVEKLPEVKAIESFTFKSDDVRDPFRPLIQPDPIEIAAMDDSGTGLRPDLSRRKEELEAFPLDSLKMVGTIDMNTKLWALVKVADNTVHRVQVGNYMGKNFGKIMRISTDKIEIMELLPDKPGTWREQQSSLVLVE